MIIVFIALLGSSLLWASSTFIDKHLISNISNDNYKGLFVFSTFVSAIIFIPVFLFLSKFNLSVDFVSLIIIFSLALCEVGYIIFYMKAIAKEDASIINSFFLFQPIIVYFLGVIFLKETYSTVQIISGLVIIFATMAMSIKFDKQGKFNKNKLIALVFMIIATLLLALQTLGFKISAINTSFYSTMFYFQVALLLIGLVALLIKPFRVAFLDLVKNNGKKIIFLNVVNEILNSVATSLKVFALSLAPIAFATIFQNSTQIIIAFLIGVLLTKLKPKTFNEDISKKTIIKKVICLIIAIVAGIFFVL